MDDSKNSSLCSLPTKIILELSRQLFGLGTQAFSTKYNNFGGTSLLEQKQAKKNQVNPIFYDSKTNYF